MHLVDDAGISLPGCELRVSLREEWALGGRGIVDPITSRSCRIGRIHTRCLRRLNYLGICNHILTGEIRLNNPTPDFRRLSRISIGS